MFESKLLEDFQTINLFFEGIVINYLLQQTFFLFSLTSLGIFAVSQPSISVGIKPSQNIWQQPYTPSYLQWLSLNLQGGVRTECGVSSIKEGKPRAFYTWKIPDAKENRLVLYVLTLASNDAVADRNFCVTTAFSKLRSEAFRMEVSPPKVELHHSHSGKDGSTPYLKTYQCSVSAALTEKDVNNIGFKDACQ